MQLAGHDQRAKNERRASEVSIILTTLSGRVLIRNVNFESNQVN